MPSVHYYGKKCHSLFRPSFFSRLSVMESLCRLANFIKCEQQQQHKACLYRLLVVIPIYAQTDVIRVFLPRVRIAL